MVETIGWVSRHPPLKRQIEELKSLFGDDIEIMQFPNTFTNAQNIVEALREKHIKKALVVVPLSMIMHIIKKGPDIMWIWADMDLAHDGYCPGEYECRYYDPDTDVIMSYNNKYKHVRFIRYRKLKDIIIEYEDF